MFGKKILALIVLFIYVCSIQFLAVGQRATVKATIEPIEIIIGEQATVSLEVIAPKGRDIVFPVFNDTLVNNVEVLGMIKPDTLYAHDVMTITQKYIITSFDSALYHIPYIPVLDGMDTIKSNDFGLKVISPVLSEATTSYLEQLKENPKDSIEFDKLAVFDVKDVLVPAFVWQDYILYGILILLFIIAIIGIIVGIYFYRKKKQTGHFFTPKVVLPPHVVALNALNEIREEKLWQQGREKEYFTELTDVLRGYISRRFHINAFEMTSDEILSFTKGLIEADSSYEGLNQVLKLADLVKFAKYKPLPNENDLSLANSILFVEQTKQEEIIPIESEEETPTSNKKIIKIKKVNEEEDEVIDWIIPVDNKDKEDKLNANNKSEK